MRQQKANVTRIFAAVALALAVSPCAFGAQEAAAKAESAALSDLAGAVSLLDAWRDYALASLKPDFSWANEGDAPVRAPSLFERGRSRIAPPATHFNGSAVDSSPFHVAMLSSKVSDTPLYVPVGSTGLLRDYSPGLQRYIVAPSISQRVGDLGSVSVSAIFAYQHFTDFAQTAPNWAVINYFDSATPLAQRTTESSSGAGLRLDYSSALTDRVNWQVGVQSRVNMDAFSNYRGVFAEPGTFDIPASTNLGLGLAVTPQLRLDVGVERVMYSQVAPFTSSALPARFLALLSSSVSPTFAWQDLDVYSIGASWRDAEAGDFSLTYSTRQQPLPTSPLLQQALPAISPRNIEFGYSHPVGSNSALRFIAAYVPNEYIIGIPQSYSLSSGGNAFQWEALWMTNF